MAFTRFPDPTNNISNLANQPVESAAVLKQKFDQFGEDDKDYTNNTLLPELESVVDGSSGADNIGVTPLPLKTANKLQAVLEEMNTDITNVTLGQIPVGSLTDLYLSNAATDLKQRFANINIVNVKDYGAVGDGVVDDTLAIQAAIDATYNQTSVGNPWDLTQVYTTNKLFFPKGKYKHTSDLIGYDYMHVFGAGRNATLIISSGCNGITFSNRYNFAIEDMTFIEMSAAKAHSGIKLNTSARFYFKNVCLKDFAIGFDFYQGFLGDFYSCFVEQCTISMKLDALNSGLGNHAIRIYGGEFTEGSVGVQVKYGNSITLLGTTLESFTTSAIEFMVGAQCDPFVIQSCYFEDNIAEVITNPADNLKFAKITDCLFSYTGSDVNKKYIYTKGLFGCAITGNSFGNPAIVYKHIDAPSGMTGDFIRDTYIENNRCGDGSTVSINTQYTDYESASGYDANHIQNGITEYDNKFMYGTKQFGDLPFFSHTDGPSSANKSQLLFNIDGTISCKYYRGFALQGTKTKLALIGQQTLTNILSATDATDLLTKFNLLLTDMKAKGYMV